MFRPPQQTQRNFESECLYMSFSPEKLGNKVKEVVGKAVVAAKRART